MGQPRKLLLAVTLHMSMGNQPENWHWISKNHYTTSKNLVLSPIQSPFFLENLIMVKIALPQTFTNDQWFHIVISWCEFRYMITIIHVVVEIISVLCPPFNTIHMKHEIPQKATSDVLLTQLYKLNNVINQISLFKKSMLKVHLATLLTWKSGGQSNLIAKRTHIYICK